MKGSFLIVYIKKEHYSKQRNYGFLGGKLLPCDQEKDSFLITPLHFYTGRSGCRADIQMNRKLQPEFSKVICYKFNKTISISNN